MKKRIYVLAVVTLVMAICFAVGVSAKIYGGTQDGVSWSLDLNDRTMTVSAQGQMPDYLNYANTPWKEYILLANTLVIDESVTNIGACAFEYGANIKEVKILGDVTEIGSEAFFGCSSLETINLPDSLIRIGHNAFADCENLENVVFPNNLSEIDIYAFSGCKVLTEIDLSQTKIAKISEGTFSGCQSLISVKVPEGVTAVENGAFYECASLSQVNYPESLEIIGERAFFECVEFESKEFLSNPSVSTDAFYNTKVQFEIIFKDDDGKTLDTLSVYAGNVPALSENPSKEQTAEYTYTFTGWDKQIVPAFENATYTANFAKTKRTYKVTWIVDGQSYVDTYEYGLDPVFTYGSGADITKPEKEGCTFAGWDITVSAVTKDITYTAQFLGDGKVYTVSFYDEQGRTLLGICTVESGGTATTSIVPEKQSDNPSEKYVFKGWSRDITNVTRNLSVKAVFEKQTVVVPGDINGDTDVTIKDAIMLSQYLADTITFSDVQKIAANVFKDDDKDGSDNINIKDAILLSQYLADMDVTLG